MRHTALSLMLVLATCSGLRATHIIGGEMYYDDLGSNQYRITLDLYRDCGPSNTNSTGFDQQVTIGVFNGNGVFQFSQTLNYNGEQIVPVVISNPCLIAPPNICIATTRYQGIFNLPPTASGYHLSFQRCCRTPALLNLQQAGIQGLTCTVQVPGTPNNLNGSPRFTNYPPPGLCIGELLEFDHSATDPDGDELVYELCSPLQGGTNLNPVPIPPTAPPYTPVPWAAGYSALQPMPSLPPVSIDPVTGLLTVQPTQAGIYQVAVCVSEYRNGLLLSRTSRDFMFTVVACDPNIQAVVPAQAPGAPCNGLTQQFGNQSINGQFWFWDFGDPTTSADTANIANPSWTYAQPGSYTVTLVANPGWPCADTTTAVYEAYLPIDPVFTPPPPLCGPGDVELMVSGNFTNAATIAWDLGAGASPATVQTVVANAAFATLGAQPVTVTVSENGCTESFTENVEVYPIPVPSIVPQSVFCESLTMAFAHNSTGATTVAWDFGDPSTELDVSTSNTPTWTYAGPGNYTVQLVADPLGPCPASTTANFQVYVNLDPSFASPAILCPGQGVVLNVQGTLFGAGANVSWDFGAVASPSVAVGAQAGTAFTLVGEHPVTVVVSENGCTGSFTGLVEVHPFPVAALMSDSRACVGNLFGFENLSLALTPMSYEWEFGDGTTSTEEDPIHLYEQPGLYTVTLTASTSTGCIASNTVVMPAQVEVFPLPIPGFSALPREVSVFDPKIEVEDGAQNAVQWAYTVEGQQFLVPSFPYYFEEGGQFTIWQVVTSADGCVDSTSRVVIVSDHIFWAPNAFTPDGDGQNDEWLPTVIGARSYRLEIFDRYGQLRFSTTDPKQGWSGEGLPTSMYTYKVWIKEWGALSKEYIGHFTLLR